MVERLTKADETEAQETSHDEHAMPLFRGLSGRLLILTIIVVMLAEVAIFVPSVARFRVDWLEERLRRAEIAALTVMAAPDKIVPDSLQQELLRRAEVLNVVVAREGRRMMVLSEPDLPEITQTFDLRTAGPVEMITDALRCLLGVADKAVFRVVGRTEKLDGERLEVTVAAKPLREDMIAYGLRVLQLSLIISCVTATVVFLAVRRIVVAPILRLVRHVRYFQQDPENPQNVITPCDGPREIVEAEEALAAMQRDVQHSLAERSRLAGLGEAVAKISHDLRNMLAAGQLMTDRLEASSDPLVARVLPKLMGSLDRAVNLCQRTLDYGRAEEAPPVRRNVALRALAEDVVEGLGLDAGDGIVRTEIRIPEGETVSADPEQLYRVLANLVRNAAEAIQASGQRGEVVLSSGRANGALTLRIADTGPGMPSGAIEHIFQPFRGGARAGGTGLGLAIAREIVQRHGGRLELVSSTTEGTEFAVTLPDLQPAGRTPAVAD